jgi:deazaflavin-dependent oxidoreductase (nitroreductase family)
VDADSGTDSGTRSHAPGAVDRAFNHVVIALARLGISLAGSRVLEIVGRRSGARRRVPVNVLRLDGDRYLVAPRGQTQWVKNLRAADGRGTLILGRRREPFVAHELADEAKEPVLRAYLRRFGWEVGRFFGGVGAGASAEALAGIAPAHPVFRIDR